MTGGILGFLVFAIMIPLVVNEAGDLARSLARCLAAVGSQADRPGRPGRSATRKSGWPIWSGFPATLTKLGYACGVVVRSVPRLRAQFRQGPRGARLPGVLPGRIMDAIGEQLAGSLEIGARLQHVAEMLVPQFADHCFIDLFQGDALIRRAAAARRRLDAAAGYLDAGRRADPVPGGALLPAGDGAPEHGHRHRPGGGQGERYPPPSARSMAAAKQVGLTSVLAAPLYARGVLLGVMSLALSDLTDRTERHYAAADRYLIGAIASQVAVAIDGAITVRGRAPDRAGPSSIAPATSWR